MPTTKVLLVDDEPSVRAIPALFLRKWGYEVFEASDGRDALQILEQHAIGIVISDWIMPNLNGIELCRHIRSGEPRPYTYLILCTSKSEKADLIEGMEAGADDFLVKPVNREEMRVRVRAGERILQLEERLAEKNRQLTAANARLTGAYERLERDLQAAAWMQANLLPSMCPPSPHVTSAWRFRPSSYLAGDIFNIFVLDERRVGFYLLDVSGHGVPAAMLSVTLSMVLKPDATAANPVIRLDAAKQISEVVSPSEVVSQLNERFQNLGDQYFTIIYGTLDVATGEVNFTQAGHPHPIVIRRSGAVAVLGEGGTPVGVLPGTEYDNTQVRLAAGDRLLLYSDGVIECANQAGEQFGEQRLLLYLQSNRKRKLPELLEGLQADMEVWHGSATFEDDVSLLAMEFTPLFPEAA